MNYRYAVGNEPVGNRAIMPAWQSCQQNVSRPKTLCQHQSLHIASILKEKELTESSVVKNYLTTAADGKNYNVVFYSLEMIIAVGYRVRDS